MNTNTEFSINERQLSLLRFPLQGDKSSLQAWDAADEYILNEVLKESADDDTVDFKNIAILNDDFGALSCALAKYQPKVYSDSYMAHRAIEENLQRNELDGITLKSSLALSANSESADAPNHDTETFSLVLIKIPRTLALLEQQLCDLRSRINEHTQIIAAAKVKSITNNTLKLFEKYIGPTMTSLAVKKARLVFATFDPNLKVSNSFVSVVSDPAISFSLYNHANVFCREQLDIGARLLLEHLPKHFSGTCIDLGCGNGVLGVAMLKKNPEAKLSFVDESFMAIESAKLTASHALSEGLLSNAEFKVSHCLQTLLDENKEKVDLVLCNPPFHQQNVITDEIAWQMFVDAKRMLKPRGELRVVANRHLLYPDKLKRLFGGCKVIANNRKFVVLSAIKLNQ